jgi:hypothetical protein
VELRDALARLDAAHRDLQGFLHVAAHDLKARIRAVGALAPRDEVEATGRGLAIAQGIVELHGGTSTVGSGLARASAFTFTLRDSTACASLSPERLGQVRV